MSFQNHRQFTNALERIDQTVLPNLSRLLDGVLDSAALARPGIDGLYHVALAAARASAERAGLERVELRPAMAARIHEPEIVTLLHRRIFPLVHTK